VSTNNVRTDDRQKKEGLIMYKYLYTLLDRIVCKELECGYCTDHTKIFWKEKINELEEDEYEPFIKERINNLESEMESELTKLSKIE
jgi:hypothetical protein